MQQISTIRTARSGELTPIKSRSLEERGRFISTGGPDAPAADLLNRVFEHAVINAASDVHFEFDEIDGLRTRVRTAGDLVLYPERLDATQARFAKTKLCTKSNLDDQERLVPMDGRLMVFFGGRRVDVRIAITPTVAGFKVVCRLLDSSNSNIDLDSLEMPFVLKKSMSRVASSPEGMLLMSGPTGSGKTTTLYALLRYLDDVTRHLVTIENPVEYAIPSFTQIDVDGNLTFAKAMKSSLRLDPDVIMVGEIRDEESADIAIKAGSSGHMVLSTVHANSASETIPRLLSFGLKTFEISPVLTAMIAQRLLKKLRPDCDLEWIPPNDIEREWLSRRGLFFDGMTLPRVRSGGYSGRIPIVEMIEMTHDIRSLIESGLDESAWLPKVMDMAAKQEHFETLAQAGVRLALSGKTTLGDVMRASSDIGQVPKTMRFEQILIFKQIISDEQLDLIMGEVHLLRLEGKIVFLKDILVEMGICSVQNIEAAIALAAKEITNPLTHS